MTKEITDNFSYGLQSLWYDLSRNLDDNAILQIDGVNYRSNEPQVQPWKDEFLGWLKDNYFIFPIPYTQEPGGNRGALYFERFSIVSMPNSWHDDHSHILRLSVRDRELLGLANQYHQAYWAQKVPRQVTETSFESALELELKSAPEIQDLDTLKQQFSVREQFYLQVRDKVISLMPEGQRPMQPSQS